MVKRFAIRHLCQKTEKIDKTIEGMRKIIGKIQNQKSPRSDLAERF